MIDKNEIQLIVEHFDVCGQFSDAEPHGNGHINNTYLITSTDVENKQHLYILQKINTVVFNKPEQVMSNIVNVTSYLNEHCEHLVVPEFVGMTYKDAQAAAEKVSKLGAYSSTLK